MGNTKSSQPFWTLHLSCERLHILSLSFFTGRDRIKRFSKRSRESPDAARTFLFFFCCWLHLCYFEWFCTVGGHIIYVILLTGFTINFLRMLYWSFDEQCAEMDIFGMPVLDENLLYSGCFDGQTFQVFFYFFVDFIFFWCSIFPLETHSPKLEQRFCLEILIKRLKKGHLWDIFFNFNFFFFTQSSN